MGTDPKGPQAEQRPGIKQGDLILDRYRVVEQIACGGHSVVYLGQDERLSRPVCIKVFSGLGGKSGVGRTSYEHFVQEAFALSRLTHPNTLRIYDFGHLGSKDVEGMPLQVCEYMNAGTLSTVVREVGMQSIAETSRVIGAMCAALSEAHALSIVHRDIKPQNILFGTVGGTKLPKLADFGIAKWSDEGGEDGERAEDTQIVAGQKLAMYSPSWAAPEQLAGQPVSPMTDIYSLAVVAVYMLSTRAIFAEEDVYAGYKKRRHADEHVRDALAPLNVAPEVIALLTRALAFDPKKRILKVEELQAGLAAAAEARSQRSRAPVELATPTVPTPALPAVDPPQKRLPTAPEITREDATVEQRRPTPPAGYQPSGPPPQRPTPNPGQPPFHSPFGAPILSAQPYPVATAAHTRGELAPTGNLGNGTGPSPESQSAGIAASGTGPPPAIAPNWPTTGAPPAPTPAPTPTPQPGSAPIPPASGWSPPVVRPPWMQVPAVPTGQPARRIGPSELPPSIDGRHVQFQLTTNEVVDLVGGQGRVRVTLMTSAKGARIVHLKGLSCFVAHLGGRPSPAVQIDQPSDIALVTPRAQEIGHIRVAVGLPSADGMLVFAIGNEAVALSIHDCSDPILFDFGPGSEAYFVYTRGRPAPVPTPAQRQRRR